MAFAGSLQDIPLADLLQLLAAQGKSGTLTLRRDDEQIRIGIADGKAVDADSSHRPLVQRLGTMLVNVGRLARADLDRALRLQQVSRGKLGQILIAERMVAPEDLRRALLLQFLQIIYDAMRWSEGSYEFERGEVDYDRDNLEPVGFQRILMDCMRMIDEWPIIERRLSRRSLVLHRVHHDGGSEAAGAAAGAADGGTLTEIEAEVYARIDGRTSIQQIVDRSLHLEFDVCRAIYDLWEQDRIRPAYEGRLEDLGFPDLVLALRRTHGSGGLELRSGSAVKTVVFRRGSFAAADSSDPDDGIGPYLLRHGLVGCRGLDRAQREAGGPGALGEHLLRIGALDPEALRRAEIGRMADVIRGLFSWTEGTYLYRPATAPGPACADLESRSAAIVLEGIQSIDRWSRIDRGVGPHDSVYRFGAGGDPDPDLAAALGGEDRSRLELFAEGASVHAAADRSDAGAFFLHKLVWGGKVLGLLSGGELPPAVRTLIAALAGEAPAAEQARTAQIESLAAAAAAAPRIGRDVEDLLTLADIDPHELLPDLEASDAAVEPAAGGEDEPAPEPPEPRGRLGGLTLGETLRRFYRAGSSGVLSLTHRRERAGLLLSRGTVVAASSADPSHRIGQVAARLGLVPERVVERVIAESKSGALGPELVARGLLTREQLSRVVDTQIRDIALPLFNWGEAEYQFEERPPGAGELPGGGITNAELILAGAREVTGTNQIGELLLEGGPLAPSSDPYLRFQRVRLQAEEASVLERMDGRRALPDLITGSPVDERETIRIVYGLLSAGLIEAAEEEVPAWHAEEMVRPEERPPLDQLPALAEKLGRLEPEAILGVKAGVSRQALLAAGARLARKYHPDHGRSAAERELLAVIFRGILRAGSTFHGPLLGQRRPDRPALPAPPIRQPAGCAF